MEDIRKLVADGCVSWIKYAIVRPDESNDPYLSELCQAVDPAMIVSGMGEQPATVHLRDFGLGGFTSGCICVAPRLSTRMLAALRSGDFATAEAIRSQFEPLENLRNTHGPIPVLHHAAAAAGISQTGPQLPLLADLSPELQEQISATARALAALDS